MDQVYLPRNRFGFDIGSYVVVKPIKPRKVVEKPYFYNVKNIEPIKIGIMKEIIQIIDENCDGYENIIFTGSFLDKGFCFNDIDLILISENKLNIKSIENVVESKLGVNVHIILLDSKTLMRGLSTDPLYQMMLSKCISKKRFIYKIKHKLNYKILDLHLLKSKTLIDNFDILNGNEKYYLTRNLIGIFLYLKKKKINKKLVDTEIKSVFHVDVNKIKQNILDKNIFLKRYRKLYKKTFDGIMKFVKNDTK